MKKIQKAKNIYDDSGSKELIKRVVRYPFFHTHKILENLVQYTPRKINQKNLFQEYGEPIKVMEKDWDNLILLDACRYDIFKNVNRIEGDLSKVVTPASHSDEFIMSNFNGHELHNTVYITANPHADKTLNEEVFHNVLKTYSTTRHIDREVEEHYPETVSEIVYKNYDKYSDKRLIIHYMQPHTPYLGKFAKKTRKRLVRSENISFKRDSGVSIQKARKTNKLYKDMLGAAADNHITNKELRHMYEENLELVLNEVENLLDTIEGKTIITADHGELLGNPSYYFPRTQKYGHPKQTYVPELNVVPWLSIESKNRRDIVSDKPKSVDKVSEEVLNNQLEALGYKS